jgi:hypothetical protein
MSLLILYLSPNLSQLVVHWYNTKPCQGCIGSKSECIFDISKGKRRKAVLIKAQSDAGNTFHILLQVVRVLYDGTDEAVKDLRGNIQCASSFQVAMVNLRSMFPR